MCCFRRYKKDCWPVTETLQIDPQQRSQLIGPSGINLKRIYLDTGASLTPENEVTFTIFAPSQAALDEAKEQIESLLKPKERIPVLKFGCIYTGKITELRYWCDGCSLSSYATSFTTQLPTRSNKGNLLMFCNQWKYFAKTSCYPVFRLLILVLRTIK